MVEDRQLKENTVQIPLTSMLASSQSQRIIAQLRTLGKISWSILKNVVYADFFLALFTHALTFDYLKIMKKLQV